MTSALVMVGGFHPLLESTPQLSQDSCPLGPEVLEGEDCAFGEPQFPLLPTLTVPEFVVVVVFEVVVDFADEEVFETLRHFIVARFFM